MSASASGRIPSLPHDVTLTCIVTPEGSGPRGIYWDCLDEDRITGIAVLGELKRAREAR